MQVTPALPWDTTEGGIIKLKKAVTYQDLLDGILRWTLDKNAAVEVGQIVAGEVGDRKLYVANTRGDKVYAIAEFTDPTNQLTLTRHADAPADTSLKSAVLPAVIAPHGDVQVFKDRFGYELASGTLSKVYVRINTPWVGDDSGWGIGSPQMENACFIATSPTGGLGTYAFSLWVDWTSEERNTPFEAGQMVEVTYGIGDSLDVTLYETDFEKPLYIEGSTLQDTWATLKPSTDPASDGESGAIIGSIFNNTDTPIFFTQDGVNAIGGIVNGTRTEIMSNGSLQTTSILNTTQKPSDATIGVKIKILKNGSIQPQCDYRCTELWAIFILVSGDHVAQIGDSAPLYLNKEQ